MRFRQQILATARLFGVLAVLSAASGARTVHGQTEPTVTIANSGIVVLGGSVEVTVLFCSFEAGDNMLDQYSYAITANYVNVTSEFAFSSADPAECGFYGNVSDEEFVKAVGTVAVTTGSGPVPVQASAYSLQSWFYNDAKTFYPPHPRGAVMVLAQSAFITTTPSASRVERFEVLNIGNQSMSFALAATGCSTGAIGACSVSPSTTSSIAPGGSAVATVSYTAAGTAGLKGLVRLRATSTFDAAVKDSAWTDVTLAAAPAAGISIVGHAPGRADVVARGACVSMALAPGVASECGDLRVTHATPAVRTMGTARAPVLLYNSQHARPKPLVLADIRIRDDVSLPSNGTTAIKVSSSTCGSASTPGSAFAAPGNTRRVLVPYAGCALTTGVVSYNLEFTSNTHNFTGGSAPAEKLIIVNRSTSRFGAGWWIAGLERLQVLSSTELLWIGGDGSARRYVKTGSIWKVPTPHSVADSIIAAGTGYARLTAEHARIFFNSAGRHDSTRNAMRHVTRFEYAGATDSLLKIKVPRSGASTHEYRFKYSAGYLDSIVAPGGRGTKIFRTAARVDSIKDPDGGVVRYRYTGTTGLEHELSRIVNRLGDSTVIAYDAGGRVASATRPLSNVLTLAVAETKGYSGPVVVDSAFTQVDGPRSDVSDKHRFWINGYGAPTRVRDALGRETFVRYSSAWPGLPDSVVSPTRVVSVTMYNTRGLPDSSKTIAPYGSAADTAITRYKWHTSLNRPVSVRTRTSTSSYLLDTLSYNSDSTMAWRQRGTSSTTRVTYGYDGTTKLPSMLVLPGADSVRFAYDAQGNLRKETSPTGILSLILNDSLGRTVTTYSARLTGDTATDSTKVVTYGLRNSVYYDVMSRDTLSVTVGPAKRLSTGRLVAADTIRLRKTYDAEGRPRLHYRYYSRNLDSTSGALMGMNPSEWRYDALGRPDSTYTAGTSGWTALTYDPAGNVVSTTTHRGNTIFQWYDALNRLTKRVVPQVTYGTSACAWYLTLCNFVFPTHEQSGLCIAADTSYFEYDVSGALRLADNNWARIRRSFAPNGALLKETQTVRTYATEAPNPCGGGDKHAGGSAVYSTDWQPHNYTLEYTYDLAGRRLTMKTPAQLDPCGTTSQSCTIRYSYDALGQFDVLKHPSASGDTLVTSYGYDSHGRVVVVSSPGDVQVSSTYDQEGRLTYRMSTGTSSIPISDTLLYDAGGRIRAGSAVVPSTGSRVQMLLEYNGLGALQRSNNLAMGLGAEEYRTDALGSALWSRDSDMIDGIDRSRISTFDLTSGQLTNVDLGTYGAGSCPGPTVSCHPAWYDYEFAQSYDASGNVISSVELDVSGTSEENATYAPAETRHYYAADEKLTYHNVVRGYVMIAGGGSGSFDEYRYDALGRRVLSRTRRMAICSTPCDAFIERTVYDGDQVLAEIRSSGAQGTLATYMEVEGGVSQTGTTPGWSDPGLPLLYGIVLYSHGQGIDQPAGVLKYRPDSGWVAITPHTNWRGSYAFGTSASGVVCTTTTPGRCPSTWPGFTEGAHHTEQGVDPAGYSSWYGSLVRGRTDASGLTFLRNRYYDPNTGRFTQMDPIGLAGGLNLYGYAGGDPVNFSDPFGLCPKTAKDGSVCLDFFIQDGQVLGSKGDGRSFDKNAGPNSSRLQVVVSPDGELSYNVSGSCTLVGCSGPSEKNNISVQQGENGSFTVNVEAYNSAMPGAPAINASVTFTPDGSGRYRTSGTRDAMPSLGIYQYRGGEKWILAQRPAKSPWHLIPGFPKDRWNTP